MTHRDTKRITIITIFLVFFIIVVLAASFVFKANPSCFDNKRNQGEGGVDCGGPCKPCTEIIRLSPLKVESVEWVHDFDDKYDVAAQALNPNDVYGVSHVRYRVVIENLSGEVLDQSDWEKNFILPGEIKHLLFHGFETEELPLKESTSQVKVEIDTDSISWERFNSFEEPNFVINNPRYEEISGGGVGFARATGTLINRSNVDFETVKVKILVRDNSGKLLAMNSQVMNTVRAGEQRDYVVMFPHRFPGSVENAKPESETNPFDSENYIRTFGVPEQWDEN